MIVVNLAIVDDYVHGSLAQETAHLLLKLVPWQSVLRTVNAYAVVIVAVEAARFYKDSSVLEDEARGILCLCDERFYHLQFAWLIALLVQLSEQDAAVVTREKLAVVYEQRADCQVFHLETE